MNTGSFLRLGGIILTPLLFGCPTGEGGSGGTLDGTSGDCVEPLPVDFLPSNPNFKNVTTGLAAPPSTHWQSIALGHVDDVASSTSCCEDYVLGSDASTMVSVVLNAPANGLVAFDDEPVVELGAEGMVSDLALADLDGDDRNDLVALLQDGRLTVRRGTNVSPFFDGSLDRFATEIGGVVGRDQIVVADNIDCDGDVDILMPSDDGVIILENDGLGTLSPMNLVPSPVPLDSVAVGDLDHDDDDDIVASASDGSVRVWIGNCGSFGAPATYGVLSNTGTYPGTRVVLALVCPSFKTSLDIVFSYGDTVDVYCGAGSGDFSNVQEAHGQELFSGADFRWQSNPIFQAQRFSELAVVGSGASQQVLGLDIQMNEILSFVPADCSSYYRGYPITLPYPTTGLPSDFSRLVATRDPTTFGLWERLAMVGGAGLQVIR